MNDDASCAGPSNPLAQISKQFSRDKSLQQEGSSRPQTALLPSARNAFRNAPGVHRPEGPNLVDEFLRSPNQEMMPGGHQDLLPPQMHHQGPSRHGKGRDWTQDFITSGQRIQEIPPEEVAAFENAFAQHHQPHLQHHPSHIPQHEWNAEFEQMNQLAHPTVKDAAEEAEFESAFQQHQGWSGEFAQAERETLQGGPLGAQVDWTKEFASFDVDDLAGEFAAAGLTEEDDAINKRFEQLWREKSDQVGEDLDDDLITGNLGNPESWSSEFANTLPTGPYTFEQDNPFLSHPDPFAEAQRLRTEGGSLQQAALAYEAALQREDHSLDAAAWMSLGEVQAENEKETAAVRALERAIQLDDQCLPAYMALAVSYVNEGCTEQAYSTLESWIRRRFPDLPVLDGPTAPLDLRSRVVDSYLIAARQTSQGDTTVDADVQLGLGVLLYGGNEFEKAVDCFVAALEARPEDYLLWNRLGATLANSGRSEEAISAYHRALDLRPSFVRARYNLGVSCINIGCYKEAGEHFLAALSMHGDGEGAVNVSSSLWETLRRVFYMMERRDLAEKAHPGADFEQFRGEFDF